MRGLECPTLSFSMVSTFPAWESRFTTVDHRHSGGGLTSSICLIPFPGLGKSLNLLGERMPLMILGCQLGASGCEGKAECPWGFVGRL